jgi:DNA excision repair protein ERCC-3
MRNPSNPLIVQGDHSVLLEVNNPLHEEARDFLARFAELEKSPEHIHTYRISPLSLWNAAAAGETTEDILIALERYSKYELPGNVVANIRDWLSRYGRLKLYREDGQLVLRATDALLITQLLHNRKVALYIARQLDPVTLLVRGEMRGHLKQALVQFGYPAEDLAGYVDGAPIDVRLRETTLGGQAFGLREYQREAVDLFWANGESHGGSGVVVLPCGAGKTVVGAGVISKTNCHTLILCFGTVAVHQWIQELVDKTHLSRDLIGEYTGDLKEIKPITVTTYQVLTHRKGRRTGTTKPSDLDMADFPHLALFTSRDWGLIVYDEVHLLPAPVFRMTAEIQARRRLGLTATLVREDGRESDVFSLIGPKKYDLPWKILEKQGWIATAECWEYRIALPQEKRLEYALSEDGREQYHVAAVNPAKLEIVRRLVDRHRRQHDDNVLVIGQYLEQLDVIAAMLDAPLITGKTTVRERERLYSAFRRGEIKLLVVSKVANFAIDLPDANVAIQVSGTFGSRQEEAQRLGRILRPKSDGSLAHFYAVVTRETLDQDYSARRQMFLTEQGYRYTILDATELINRVPGE